MNFDTPMPLSREDEQRIIQEKLMNMKGAVKPISDQKEKLEALDRMIASTGPQEVIDPEGYGEEPNVDESMVNEVPMDPMYDEEVLKKEALLKAIQAKLNME